MTLSKANDVQVGGTHYKTEGEQHWDRQYRMFGPAYFIGCITKYVERYRKKNGIQDLEKAKHFIEKLIELERARTVAAANVAAGNNLKGGHPVEAQNRGAGMPGGVFGTERY